MNTIIIILVVLAVIVIAAMVDMGVLRRKSKRMTDTPEDALDLIKGLEWFECTMKVEDSQGMQVIETAILEALNPKLYLDKHKKAIAMTLLYSRKMIDVMPGNERRYTISGFHEQMNRGPRLEDVVRIEFVGGKLIDKVPVMWLGTTSRIPGYRTCLRLVVLGASK